MFLKRMIVRKLLSSNFDEDQVKKLQQIFLNGVSRSSLAVLPTCEHLLCVGREFPKEKRSKGREVLCLCISCCN